jgi:carbon-monoxide dehydrogenase medium subunit
LKRLHGFNYHEPVTVAEAIATLASEGEQAQVLAGGTDLIVDMKIERLTPTAVVNIKRIPGLSGIQAVARGTRIGALTTVVDVEESPLVQQHHPALAEAASILASPPVRALATIAGNVGRASPASDLGPALIVHDAVATIEGVDGVRDELVEDLYAGPGTTTMASSDIITSFLLPDTPDGFGSAHVKLGKRMSGTDIALAGVSTSVVIGASGVVDDCRIALASLGPTPFRATAAEDLLIGQLPIEAALGATAEAASAAARPISDMRASASYRTTLARVLTLRALRIAVRSAAPGESSS